MSSPDNKVRVFISSTFRDMHAERDHLVTVVFPELRERCERLGLEFFDVDLRWGVPDKNVDGESANSWEYCRKWINEAKPFFVCLLGQRYGWEPDGSAIKNDDALKAAQSNPVTQRSITDLEVHHALEHEGHSRRCFFYLRQAQAPETATEFVDPEPDKRRKLERLKAHIRHCDRPVWDYPCEWKDDHFIGMEKFGQRVLDDLWSGILRDPRYVSEEVWEQVLGTDPAKDSRYKDETTPVPEDIAEKLIPLAKPPPKNPLEAEREEMRRFADSRLRWFQGRENELKQLTDFIINPAEDGKPRLAVIAAVPGQGKSALMAKLAAVISSPQKNAEDTKNPASSASEPFASYAAFCCQSLFLISHFVGATSHSSSSYHLVKRVLDELDASGIAFPERPTPEGQSKEEPKLDFQSLCQRLWDRLGDYADEPRIVILLDALNQLDDGHELGWLPYRLGPGVRIVVSCIEEPFVVPASAGHADGPDRVNAELPATPAEKVLTALDSRHPKPLRVPLKGITPVDVRAIVTGYLKEYCKELDAPHVDALCTLPQACNPLYLLVLLAELRTLGGNDMNQHVPALIADLGTKHPDTVSLFQWVLERLEKAEGFGKEAVQAWCLYLALGRVGMSSRELSDLLVRKLGPESAATAQRIERALRRYLQRRDEQWDFFHGQLRHAVIERCTHSGTLPANSTKISLEAGNAICESHHEIASYFRAVVRPSASGHWKDDEKHALRELPHHQIQARDWPCVISTLEDIFFLEAKVRAGMICQLADDFSAAVLALPPDHPEKTNLRLLEEALRADLQFIASHACEFPQAVFQCLWNTCWWYDSTVVPEHHRGTCQTIDLPEKRPAFNERCPLHILMERWHTQRQLVEPGFHWIRSIRPPMSPVGRGEVGSFIGDGSEVTSVTLSQDGRYVACSEGYQVRVWEVDSKQCISVLCGHTGDVTCVRFSGKSNMLATSSKDGFVRLWDFRGNSPIMTLEGPGGWSNGVAFSPDGEYLAGAFEQATVCLWACQSGRMLGELQGDGGSANCVSFSPDGKHLITGANFHGATVWNLETRAIIATLLPIALPFHNCADAAFSPCGKYIALAHGSEVSLWCAVTNIMLVRMEGHEGEATGVGFSSNGLRLVSSSKDRTVRLWDINSRKLIAVYRGHRKPVSCVAFSPDSRWVVSGSSDGTVRLWDEWIVGACASIQNHGDHVSCVAFSPDGKLLASSSRDATIRLWDATKGTTKFVMNNHRDEVTCIAFSPDGSLLASGGGLYDGKLRLWDARNGEEVATAYGHQGEICSVAFSPDGGRVVSGGGTSAVGLLNGDYTVRLWNAKDGSSLHVMRGHVWPVSSIAFSPDGSLVASGSYDGSLRLWEVHSGRCVESWMGHEIWRTSRITGVCFSPSGRYVAGSSNEGEVFVWDTKRNAIRKALFGSLVLKTECHRSKIDRLIFSDDGKHLVTSSWDGTTCVWRARDGKRLRLIAGCSDPKAITSAMRLGNRFCLFSRHTYCVLLDGCDRAIAYFPFDISHLTSDAEGRMWAGCNSEHVFLVRIEGSFDAFTAKDLLFEATRQRVTDRRGMEGVTRPTPGPPSDSAARACGLTA